MTNRLKHLWLKYKWYIVVGVFLILTVFAFMFGLQDDFNEELNKWLFDKKTEMVEEAVRQKKEAVAKHGHKIEDVDKEVAEIDEKIKNIKEKRKATDKEIDKKDARELADAFKKLGF